MILKPLRQETEHNQGVESSSSMGPTNGLCPLLRPPPNETAALNLPDTTSNITTQYSGINPNRHRSKKIISYHPGFDINIHFIANFASFFSQHRRAQEEPGGTMSISSPAVQLPHGMDGCLGSGFIEALEGRGSSDGREKSSIEILFPLIMVPKQRKRADISFSCKNEKSLSISTTVKET